MPCQSTLLILRLLMLVILIVVVTHILPSTYIFISTNQLFTQNKEGPVKTQLASHLNVMNH